MTNLRPRRAQPGGGQPGALAEEIGLLRDLLRQMQERVDDEQPLKELLSLADSLGRTTTRIAALLRAEEPVSIGLYGVHQRILALAEASQERAEALRDAVLAAQAHPQPQVGWPGETRKDVVIVRLIAHGWWQALNQRSADGQRRGRTERQQLLPPAGGRDLLVCGWSVVGLERFELGEPLPGGGFDLPAGR